MKKDIISTIIFLGALLCFGLSIKFGYEMIASPSEIITTRGLAGPSSFQFSFIFTFFSFVVGLGLLAFLRIYRK